MCHRYFHRSLAVVVTAIGDSVAENIAKTIAKKAFYQGQRLTVSNCSTVWPTTHSTATALVGRVGRCDRRKAENC